MGEKRRLHPRYALEVGVTSGNLRLACKTRDISEAGVFVDTSEPPPVGTRVRLRLEVEGSVFHVDARVAWIRGAPGSPAVGFGAEFVGEPPGVRKTIQRIVERPGAGNVEPHDESPPPSRQIVESAPASAPRPSTRRSPH